MQYFYQLSQSFSHLFIIFKLEQEYNLFFFLYAYLMESVSSSVRVLAAKGINLEVAGVCEI